MRAARRHCARVLCGCLAVLMLVGPIPDLTFMPDAPRVAGLLNRSAWAADIEALHRDLATHRDFRIRVAAALSLGKLKKHKSVPVLAVALTDATPAVRGAAAAALAAIGDVDVLAALQRAKDSEKNASARGAMEKAIISLSDNTTRFLIAIGRLEAKSHVRSKAAVAAFRSTARDRLGKLRGCELVRDRDLSTEARKRKLPAIVLDGQLTNLQNASAAGDVGFMANVEFLLRKVPDQALKGSIRGEAKALLNAAAVQGAKDLSQLEIDAVEAAVGSALKSAPNAIELATKN